MRVFFSAFLRSMKQHPAFAGCCFLLLATQGGNALKHKCPSPRIGKKPRGNIGRWLYAAFLTATLSASLCQPASAATVWEKANEIMRDVYTQILGISTIAAIVTAAVALLMMNFSRSGRTVDESRAWLKRIIITWAVLNGLGFIMSYVTPFFSGGQWTAS